MYDRRTLAFLAVNEAAIAQYGYTRDQFLAMRLVDIVPDVTAADMRALLDNPGRRRRWRHSGVRRHRKANGAFRSMEQLALVKGIGLKTVEKNRDRIVIGSAPAKRPAAKKPVARR